MGHAFCSLVGTASLHYLGEGTLLRKYLSFAIHTISVDFVIADFSGFLPQHPHHSSLTSLHPFSPLPYTPHHPAGSGDLPAQISLDSVIFYSLFLADTLGLATVISHLDACRSLSSAFQLPLIPCTLSSKCDLFKIHSCLTPGESLPCRLWPPGCGLESLPQWCGWPFPPAPSVALHGAGHTDLLSVGCSSLLGPPCQPSRVVFPPSGSFLPPPLEQIIRSINLKELKEALWDLPRLDHAFLLHQLPQLPFPLSQPLSWFPG